MTEKIGLEAIHREGLERLWDAPSVSAADLVGMTCGHKLDWEKVLLQLRDLRLVACASIGMILPPQCRWWLTFRGVQVTQTLKGMTPPETATDPVPWQVSRIGLAAILDRMAALEMFYDTLPAFLEAGRYSHLASGFGSYGRPRLIGIDLLRSDGVHAIATFEGDIKIGLVWAGSRWGPAQARSKQVNRHLTLTVEGASETAPMSAVAVPADIRSGVSVWVVVGWDTWAAQAAWKTFSGSFPSPPVELFTATGGRINAPAELLPCYRTIRDGDPFAQVGDVDGFATRLEHDLAQHALHEQPGFRVLVTVEEWPDMRADEIAVMADEDIDRVEQTLKRLKEVSLVTEFEQRWSIADQGLVRRARQDRVWVVDARKSTRFPKPGLGQRRRLNRLSLVNELAVRFKSEGVPVVAG